MRQLNVTTPNLQSQICASYLIFICFLHNPPTNLTADGGGVYKLFHPVAFFRSANSKILQAFQMMRPQAIDIISPTTYLTLQFCFKEDN